MDESEALKQRISKLSDEELIAMVTTEAADYRQEALVLAEAELKKRGIDPEQLKVEEEQSEQVNRRPAVDGQLLKCPSCGGKLRNGTLVAEKEITIFFSDNREERFVRVSACSQCGQISMSVDFETDVQ